MERLDFEKQRISRNLTPREKGKNISMLCKEGNDDTETIHFKDAETAKEMENGVYEFIRERSFHSVHVCCGGAGYMFSVTQAPTSTV
jgi:hypothetical protein